MSNGNNQQRSESIQGVEVPVKDVEAQLRHGLQSSLQPLRTQLKKSYLASKDQQGFGARKVISFTLSCENQEAILWLVSCDTPPITAKQKKKKNQSNKNLTICVFESNCSHVREDTHSGQTWQSRSIAITVVAPRLHTSQLLLLLINILMALQYDTFQRRDCEPLW